MKYDLNRFATGREMYKRLARRGPAHDVTLRGCRRITQKLIRAEVSTTPDKPGELHPDNGDEQDKED